MPMAISKKLLHELKKQVWGIAGLLLLVTLLKVFGLVKIPNDSAFWYVGGALIVLGFWFIQCVEIIIIAVKEDS